MDVVTIHSVVAPVALAYDVEVKRFDPRGVHGFDVRLCEEPPENEPQARIEMRGEITEAQTREPPLRSEVALQRSVIPHRACVIGGRSRHERERARERSARNDGRGMESAREAYAKEWARTPGSMRRRKRSRVEGIASGIFG